VSFEDDGTGCNVACCDAEARPLNGNTVRHALAIATWFEAHQSAMLAPMREAAGDEKFERVFARCYRRNDWTVTARDLVGARITENRR
jgi:hypothetical protein